MLFAAMLSPDRTFKFVAVFIDMKLLGQQNAKHVLKHDFKFIVYVKRRPEAETTRELQNMFTAILVLR